MKKIKKLLGFTFRVYLEKLRVFFLNIITKIPELAFGCLKKLSFPALSRFVCKMTIR